MAGVSNRACSVGFASCLVSRLGCHIVWQLSAADFKHPCLKLGASTIVHPCTFMNTLWALRPCNCGRLGRRVLAPTLCDRYRASLHDPHSASSPPGTKKAGLCLFEITEMWRAGCRIAVVGVGASLRRLCATAIAHPCATRK